MSSQLECSWSEVFYVPCNVFYSWNTWVFEYFALINDIFIINENSEFIVCVLETQSKPKTAIYKYAYNDEILNASPGKPYS